MYPAWMHRQVTILFFGLNRSEDWGMAKLRQGGAPLGTFELPNPPNSGQTSRPPGIGELGTSPIFSEAFQGCHLTQPHLSTQAY